MGSDILMFDTWLRLNGARMATCSEVESIAKGDMLDLS